MVNYFAVAALTAIRTYGISALDIRPLLVVVPLSLVNPITIIVSGGVLGPLQQGPENVQHEAAPAPHQQQLASC